MKKTKFLEFKSEISNSFLKTVSAYSNIGTGIIKFGYNDDGSVCGLKGDLKQICLDLENKINDSISPKPNYRFECNFSNNTIDLLVYEGLFKPYMYKAKAYKRNDTSTIKMDRLEFQRTILEGKSLTYEHLDVEGKLEFKSFGKKVIIDYLTKGIRALSNDLVNITGFTKDKVLRLLKSLQGKGYVKVSGVGKLQNIVLK